MNTGIVSMTGSQVDSPSVRPPAPAAGKEIRPGPPAAEAARALVLRQAPDLTVAALPEEAQAEPDVEALEEAVEQLNASQREESRQHLHFEVDEGSGRTVITVFDSETQEIIRQIPPKEVVGLARRLADGELPSLLSTQA